MQRINMKKSNEKYSLRMP